MAIPKYVPLTLHFSDAVDTVYPRQTEKLIADDGAYDYFRRVEENEQKDIMWRTKTAKGLIEKYKRNQKDKEYIFGVLPHNYRLYEHIKGRKDEKSGGTISERRDTYLFGHPSGKRFRSPAEFMPHVLHLAAQDDKKCVCWICAGGKHGNPPAAIKKVSKREAEAAQAARVVALEERQKEQETAGWVLRKGEVIWVWLSDNPEAEEEDDNDALVDGDGGLWVAGVVAERPSFTPPFQKVRKASGNSFADIEMDDNPPPWHQEGESEIAVDKTYIVQLCSDPPKTGQVLNNVPQYHVKPWLSRRECIEPPSSYSGNFEHPSIPQARHVVETFCLFDRIPKSAPDPTSNTLKLTYYQGAFVGAEKIYIHEPVRISSANDDEAEDVLVVDKIYTATTVSETPSKRSDSKKNTQTITFFQGNVYTAYPSTLCTPLTPQQFIELPFRMRRGSGAGEIIKWFVRNRPDERGDCSLKMVLGRWYEPQVVKEWIGSTGFSGGLPSSRDQALCQKDVKRWTTNRAEALELVSLNGIDLESEGVVKIQPGKLTMEESGDAMDVDTPAAGVRVTPERGFKSVNLRISSTTPGRNISPKKTPGTLTQEPEEEEIEDVEGEEDDEDEDEVEDEDEDEDDEDEDEDEDDEDEDELVIRNEYKQPGLEVLSQSPTKRRGV